MARRLNYTLKTPAATPAASRSGSSVSGSMDQPGPAPRKEAAPAQVGKPLGAPKRNPLELIKVGRGG